MNQKFPLINFIAIVYEIICIVFFLITRPEFTIQILPLSWFVAMPMLIFPIVFIVLILEAPKIFSFLYCLSKSIQFIGIVSYIIRDYQFALVFGATNNYYSLRNLLWLVLILIFDVILCVVVLNKNKTGKKNDSTEVLEK